MIKPRYQLIFLIGKRSLIRQCRYSSSPNPTLVGMNISTWILLLSLVCPSEQFINPDGSNGRSIIIDSRKHSAGILTTPGFPHFLPLPLDRSWVFINTFSATGLTFYFTEYYLSGTNRLIITAGRKEIYSEDWFRRTSVYIAPSKAQRVILHLNLSRVRSLEDLHYRSDVITDRYGFNITFEFTSNLRRAFSSESPCSFMNCNLNGICLVDYANKELKNFHCHCGAPLARPRARFSGSRCEHNEGLKICSSSTNPCANKGACSSEGLITSSSHSNNVLSGGYSWSNTTEKVRNSFGRKRSRDPSIHKLCIKGIVLKPAHGYIKVGDEFSLSCTVSGSVKPSFLWFKDQMKINSKISVSRFLKFDVKTIGKEKIGILTIGRAEIIDNGEFRCKVFETAYGSEVEAQTEYSVAHLVKVYSTPQIVVYPSQTTLIKRESFDDEDSYIGNKTFHCSINMDDNMIPREQDQYIIQWYKEEKLLTNLTISTEYVEKLYIGGSLLKLGNIKREGNYFCKVTDTRTNLFAVNKVRVHLSALKDVCESIEYGFMTWPRISRGYKATSPCPEGTGSVKLKCNPTLPGNPPSWEMYPDYSECVRKSLIKVLSELEHFVNGYIASKMSIFLPYVQIMDLPTIVGSNPLQRREWDFVINFVNKILEYISLKASIEELESNKFIQDFYTKFISWLFASLSASSPTEKPQRAVQLLGLIRKTSLIFAHKIRMNEYRILGGDREKILVKIAKIRGPRKNSNISSLRFEDLKSTTTAYLSLEKSDTISEASIAFHKQFDILLDEVISNRIQNNTLVFRRHSPLVTASMTNQAANVILEIQHEISSPEDGRLSCGRLVSGTSVHWIVSDPSCVIKIEKNLTACQCKKLGSYAVLWQEEDTSIDLDGRLDFGNNRYVVSLCCIESLTLSILTTIGLLYRFCHKRSGILWKQIEVSICISVIMIVLIFHETNHLSELDPWITPLSEAASLYAVICQMVILILLKIELSKTNLNQNLIKVMSYGLPIFLTLLYYLGISFFENYGHMSFFSSDSRWFLTKNSSFRSTAYLSVGCILMCLYIPLCFRMAQDIKGSNLYKFQSTEPRLSFLKRSTIMTANLMVFILSSYLFMKKGRLRSIFFAIPCASMGVVVLMCYAFNQEGKTKEWRKLFWSAHPPSPLSSIKVKRRRKVYSFGEIGPLLPSINIQRETDMSSGERSLFNKSSESVSLQTSFSSRYCCPKPLQVPCRLSDIEKSAVYDTSDYISRDNKNCQITPMSLSQILRQADYEKKTLKKDCSSSRMPSNLKCPSSEYVDADSSCSYMSMKPVKWRSPLRHSFKNQHFLAEIRKINESIRTASMADLTFKRFTSPRRLSRRVRRRCSWPQSMRRRSFHHL